MPAAAFPRQPTGPAGAPPTAAEPTRAVVRAPSTAAIASALTVRAASTLTATLAAPPAAFATGLLLTPRTAGALRPIRLIGAAVLAPAVAMRPCAAPIVAGPPTRIVALRLVVPFGHCPLRPRRTRG